MKFTMGQTIAAKGYISYSNFLWGMVGDFERKIGYHEGRLSKGFFVAHLLRLPLAGEFDLAPYSNRADHKGMSVAGLDVAKVKQLALEKMREVGYRNLLKVFPNTPHDPDMDLDVQYRAGLGIPQWKLTKEVPMLIFKEVPAGFKGNISALGV